MNTVTKNYSSKSSAKRALRSIFGAGIYSQCGNWAEARFMNGVVDGCTLTLSSSYWGDYSIERAFKIGIDNI